METLTATTTPSITPPTTPPTTPDTTPATSPAPTSSATPAAAAAAVEPTSEPEKPGVWETIELKADEFEDALEHVVREGAVRRIVVRGDGEVIAEFPLAVGVIGAVLAAPVAATAAIVALLGDCTIEVERRSSDDEAAASDEPAVEAVEPHAAVSAG